MEVRFWGTRGSIAKPGPATARYGGNTSCVEVRTEAGTLVVIDCGTGSHGLGQLLASEGKPVCGHILISHTHWDHIQGIPFFAPLFVPGNEWDIYGPKGLSSSIRETLAGQMEHTYFPVALDKFAATIRYHDLVEGHFEIGEMSITTRYLNHPALTLGYRLEADGASIVYCCDHEPNTPALASGEGEIVGHDRRYADFVADADLVIHDAQYTAADFPAKIGWGHSSAEFAAHICREACVRTVALTHHDPLRDDAAVDRILAAVKASVRESGSPLEVVAAAEGETIRLVGRSGKSAASKPPGFAAKTQIDPQALRGCVVMRVDDAGILSILEQAIAGEGLSAQIVDDEAALMRAVRERRPTLVVVQHHPPGLDGLAITQAIRREGDDAKVQVPVAVVTTAEDIASRASEAPTDWLVKPFSVSYARAKIRAWTLRSASRWVRAQLPLDEARRLGALRDLGILDTKEEERFDRLTRLAAAALDVPIALVSLVDAERQWFKSCYGLSARQTPRDEAFCAHVVHQRTDMVVPDTLQDGRFAENPLVTGEPRVRFYAGAPLMLEDGHCIGTFCLIDVRPRTLDPRQLALLHDLRDLALAEITAPAAGP